MKPVPEMFEDQVRRTPEATALIEGDREITYRILNERANQLAHQLKANVEPETMIGISIPQSIETVIGVMGILKAGGTYVPLDPSYPRDRIDEMISDTGLKVVVDRAMVLEACGNTDNPDSGSNLDSAAYVLYTSGSTGKPKGVIGIHRSIVNGLLSVKYAPDEKCCLNASLSFGLSLANLFLPLMTGVPLVVLAEGVIRDLVEFVNALEKASITRVVLLPPVFKQMLDLPRVTDKLRTIREVGVVGAALTADLLTRFREVMPDARLHNTYSASEIGTLATMWNAPPNAPMAGEIVIGRPVPNTRIYLLNETMAPVAAGEIGEIYVGASHLARGYLNRPEETARQFVINEGERLFRTGDLGRLMQNGDIEFVGRGDDQVKIRGYRIVLAEVERALAVIKGVRDAAVAAHVIGNELRLVGYVVSDPTLRVTELRKLLGARLPEFMIPSAFVFLDGLPLSDNGKLDRAALRSPDSERPRLEVEYIAPRNEIEVALAGIWSDLFGLEEIGIHDHFLELGGDSLFAAELAAQLLDRFGVEVRLETLFDHGTIAEIAARIPGSPTGGSKTDSYVQSAIG